MLDLVHVVCHEHTINNFPCLVVFRFFGIFCCCCCCLAFDVRKKSIKILCFWKQKVLKILNYMQNEKNEIING